MRSEMSPFVLFLDDIPLDTGSRLLEQLCVWSRSRCAHTELYFILVLVFRHRCFQVSFFTYVQHLCGLVSQCRPQDEMCREGHPPARSGVLLRALGRSSRYWLPGASAHQ